MEDISPLYVNHTFITVKIDRSILFLSQDSYPHKAYMPTMSEANYLHSMHSRIFYPKAPRVFNMDFESCILRNPPQRGHLTSW
jgi:hypothetical protein